MNDALFILAGTAFLAFAALTVLALIVISLHRTDRVPLAEIHGRRSGALARHVLAGFRPCREEDG